MYSLSNLGQKHPRFVWPLLILLKLFLSAVAFPNLWKPQYATLRISRPQNLDFLKLKSFFNR